MGEPDPSCRDGSPDGTGAPNARDRTQHPGRRAGRPPSVDQSHVATTRSYGSWGAWGTSWL